MARARVLIVNQSEAVPIQTIADAPNDAQNTTKQGIQRLLYATLYFTDSKTAILSASNSGSVARFGTPADL